ncbi:MAG: CoA-binding protein [Actinomycetota bacterium]
MSILIDEKIRVLVQGITGREASLFTKYMLDYGTNVVGGVTPGKGGQTIHGIPVFDCVNDVVKNFIANTSIISVPPPFAKDAALEAIDANIKLIVIFTERIPKKDVVLILDFAEQKGTKVIGPNSLGIISPGKSKVGAIGGPQIETKKSYMIGPAGIASTSGGMTTELANLLTSNGIGQSTCISVGGDPIVGMTFRELLPLFEKDTQTKVVVLFCEPGGTQEEDAARYIIEHSYSKPVIAFIGGRFVDEMPGMRFGHAGVIVQKGKGTAKGKIEAFKRAGVLVADTLTQLVDYVKESLS